MFLALCLCRAQPLSFDYNYLFWGQKEKREHYTSLTFLRHWG